VHVDLPDADAGRRLVELYGRGLELDLSRVDRVLERSEGVTASFLKELLRRATVIAADADAGPDRAAAVRVGADHLERALDGLLDTRNQMTRVVLGFREDHAE
jgi:hypothetical protein